MMTRRCDIVIAFLLAALAGCMKPGAPLPTVDDATPKLALPLANGGVYDPSAATGKLVLLNFWSPG